MEALADYSSDSDDEQEPSKARKRPRTTTACCVLPAVDTSRRTTSMVDWPTDYLSSKQQHQQQHQQQQVSSMDETKSITTTTRLDQVASSVENPSAGWAEQLQKQKEFHNPHFFESVVEHFGLQAMGSNLRTTTKEMLHYDETWENINSLVLRRDEGAVRARNRHPSAPAGMEESSLPH